MSDPINDLSRVEVVATAGGRRLVVVVADVRDDLPLFLRNIRSRLAAVVEPGDVVTVWTDPDDVSPSDVVSLFEHFWDAGRVFLRWLSWDRVPAELVAAVPPRRKPGAIGGPEGVGAFGVWFHGCGPGVPGATRRFPPDVASVIRDQLTDGNRVEECNATADAAKHAVGRLVAKGLPMDHVVVVADLVDAVGRGVAWNAPDQVIVRKPKAGHVVAVWREPVDQAVQRLGVVAGGRHIRGGQLVVVSGAGIAARNHDEIPQSATRRTSVRN